MTADSRVRLFIGRCPRTAMDFACRRDHYSGCAAAGRMDCFGVWEWGVFIGALSFSRGACQHIGSPFGLPQTQVVELTRIALAKHETPVSRILRISVRLLRAHSAGLRLIISFADPRHNHHGGVYAGAGWLYLGTTAAEALLRVNGRETHPRTVASRYGTRDIAWLRANVDPMAERIVCPPKHRYALPLDDAMRRQIAHRALPYPKRVKQQALADHASLAGASPSHPLQIVEAGLV